VPKNINSAYNQSSRPGLFGCAKSRGHLMRNNNLPIVAGSIVAIRCPGFAGQHNRYPIAATGKVIKITGQLVKVAVSGFRLPHYFLTSQLWVL